MHPDDEIAHIDAIFISPHKFIGGPGTPAIIESIRAGLVFQLKEAVGVPAIHALEEKFLARAFKAFSEEPSIEVLRNMRFERLSILSFVIKGPIGKYLHHNFVVALLNDLFGIQSRGGCKGIKPRWVRIVFNYFTSDPVVDHIIESVLFVTRHGHLFLRDYLSDPITRIWRHKKGPVEPPMKLSSISYDIDGAMIYPIRDDRAPESALKDYISEALEMSVARQKNISTLDYEVLTSLVGERFENLRWFELPKESLITGLEG